MPRKEKKYHVICKTTNTITGRYYIGMHSTDNLDDGYLGSGRRLKYSVKKYGKDNHIVEILEHCLDRSSLIEKEKEIVNHDLIKDEYCMNLHTGGMCGPISNLGSKRSEETKKKMGAWIRTDEMRKKISESNKKYGHQERLGAINTSEHNEKISAGKKGKIAHNKGRPMSEATKEKMRNPKSEATKEKIKQARLGKKMSEETKEKLRQINLGKKRGFFTTKNSRVILQFDMKGVQLNIFESLSEASRATNVAKSNILNVCTGKYKHASGFIWKFDN